jgi:hypothetical protein
MAASPAVLSLHAARAFVGRLCSFPPVSGEKESLPTCDGDSDVRFLWSQFQVFQV